MSTTAKRAEYLRQLKALEDDRKKPVAQKKLKPRDRIRIRLRCRLCGRARAVYRKFGVCRICFRDMASNGLIPGLKKASW
jgi:ribosomal protein S14